MRKEQAAHLASILYNCSAPDVPGGPRAQAEQTPDAVRDKVVAAKLKCAGALAALEAKKYKLAAKKFTEARAPNPPKCPTGHAAPATAKSCRLQLSASIECFAHTAGTGAC